MTSPLCLSGQANGPSPFIGNNLQRGQNIRIIRLALSVNGELTQANGGKAETLASVDTWLENVNYIYGKEYSIQFELVEDNDILIFDDPATDPWQTMPVGSGGCDNAGLILDEQKMVIDNLLGEQNYDLSHVLLGEPYSAFTGCAGSVYKGISGGLDIRPAVHEIGHQLGQYHTINNTTANYEPENAGRSIHGGNTDPYPHSDSFHRLAEFLAISNPNLGIKVPTGNNIPTVDAGNDYTIPKATPFVLTGQATDGDNQDILTYVWDQLDGSGQQILPPINDLEGALFSRFIPTTSNSRVFPRLSSILSDDLSNDEEHLPTQARDLNFRLSINDNHILQYEGRPIIAGGVNSDDVKITVADAGPFQITSQSMAGISYDGGSTQQLTWDVNQTNLAPINASEVMVTLSVDGGMSFPIELTGAIPNNGSTTVTLPNLSTSNARIKITPVNNIFFAINTHDFTITPSLLSPGISVSQSGSNTLVSEEGQTDTYTLSTLTELDGPITINLSSTDQLEMSMDGSNFSSSINVDWMECHLQTLW